MRPWGRGQIVAIVTVCFREGDRNEVWSPGRVDVLTPRTFEEALRLKADWPEAVPIQGGTDVMVDLNFDRVRPLVLLNLGEVRELRGWSARDGALWLGAGLTFAEVMGPVLAARLPALAEAARTVGGPQVRNRGTIGGNLGTASPARSAPLSHLTVNRHFSGGRGSGRRSGSLWPEQRRTQ